jgi:hypothetical protein
METVLANGRDVPNPPTRRRDQALPERFAQARALWRSRNGFRDGGFDRVRDQTSCRGPTTKVVSGSTKIAGLPRKALRTVVSCKGISGMM